MTICSNVLGLSARALDGSPHGGGPSSVAFTGANTPWKPPMGVRA